MQNIVIIFLLNLFGSALGNLKTVFLSRQITKPVYFTTFIDAVIFTYAITLVANSPSLAFICSYAAGKLCGVFTGELIDKKLALGIVEVTIYKHPEEGIELADKLRDLGYSVTTFKGYGIHGKPRLILQVIIPRKHLLKLKEYLDGSPNYAVQDVTRTCGKMGKVIIKEEF